IVVFVGTAVKSASAFRIRTVTLPRCARSQAPGRQRGSKGFDAFASLRAAPQGTSCGQTIELPRTLSNG
ncbi:hypothetical protein AAY78_01950, partial [Microbacterium sp. Ag1]